MPTKTNFVLRWHQACLLAFWTPYEVIKIFLPWDGVFGKSLKKFLLKNSRFWDVCCEEKIIDYRKRKIQPGSSLFLFYTIKVRGISSEHFLRLSLFRFERFRGFVCLKFDSLTGSFICFRNIAHGHGPPTLQHRAMKMVMWKTIKQSPYKRIA